MSTAGNLLQYVFPVLIVSIAVILLCFYFFAKKKRGSYDVPVPPVQDERRTVPLPEDGADVFNDSPPPRYSSVDPPPPYSLFDPKLTNVWLGGAPPAYEMYPITLPLAPHHWTTLTEPLPSTSQPQRHRPASST